MKFSPKISMLLIVSILVIGLQYIFISAVLNAGENRCHKAVTFEGIDLNDSILQPGDIIFRRENGLTSRAVLAVDKKASFSHVDIVVVNDSGIVIVHAEIGENYAYPNPVKI